MPTVLMAAAAPIYLSVMGPALKMSLLTRVQFGHRK